MHGKVRKNINNNYADVLTRIKLVLQIGKMVYLNKFDKVQIVMADRLGRSISKISRLVASHSIVS